MSRKILYISGTRADYGLMRETLSRIQKTPGLSLSIIATGMHLMPEFGLTSKDIVKDGFKNIHYLNATYKEDDRRSMAEFIGKFILLLTQYLAHNKTDIMLLLGDRAEMLGGAISAAYSGGIAIAHIHGGEITSTIDEPVRHAITRLSHIHLCATKKSAERIIKMGENEKNVHLVGAPGLDEIFSSKYTPRETLSIKYHFDPREPLALLIQHPVTTEIQNAGKQITNTLKALLKTNIRTIIIYPNADPGGRKMISVIKKFISKSPKLTAYPSIPRFDYLGLMRCASFMMGNSSSGIIEAPSFGLPAINIGTRQSGRDRAANIIDTRGYSEREIISAIKKVLTDRKFLEKVRLRKNPYGDGQASRRIVEILKKVQITKELLQKKLNYSSM